MRSPEYDKEATLAYATKVRDLLLVNQRSRVLDLPDEAWAELLTIQQAHFEDAAELQAELARVAGEHDIGHALAQLWPEMTGELQSTLAAISGAHTTVERALEQEAWDYAKANLEF